MTKHQLVIATRQSPLALWQANWVKECLEIAHPHLQVSLLGLTTSADKMPYLPLTKVGGKGLFVKELEDALLNGKADIAVHSMKDMPMILPDGLVLPVICARDEPWDALVSNAYQSLHELPEGAIVGTSSLRRQAQLLALRPDLIVSHIRGNVNTRITKLDEDEFSALILAVAGLNRLGLRDRIKKVFTEDEFLPAAGQGALGIECRANDDAVISLIQPLNDLATFVCVSAERAMCKQLGASCQVPVGAFATLQEDRVLLRGLVAETNGELVLHAEFEASQTETAQLGMRVAEELLLQGADKILASLPKE